MNSTVMTMSVDASHRPLSEGNLSSDELFQSFMDIAITFGESNLVEDALDCQLNCSHTAKVDDHLHDAKDDSKDQPNLQSVGCAERANIPKETTRDPVSDRDDLTELNPVENSDSMILLHDDKGISNNCHGDKVDVQSLTVRTSKDCDLNRSIVNSLGSDSASNPVEDFEFGVQANSVRTVSVGSECLNHLLANRQPCDMDITVGGVKFLWDPCNGSCEIAAKSSAVKDQTDSQSNDHYSGLPVVDYDCADRVQEGQDAKQDTHGHGDTRPGGENKKSTEGGNMGLIRELYYDSPRVSTQYDDGNIQKCLDIIQERLQTSSDVDSSIDQEEKNSIFYYSIDSGSASARRNQSDEQSTCTVDNRSDVNVFKHSQGSTKSNKSDSISSRSSESDCQNGDEKSLNSSHNGRTRSLTSSEIELMEEYSKPHRSHSDLEKNPVVFSGTLVKLGGSGLKPKNWRRRWFELRGDNCLYYYKSIKDRSPAGTIILANYLVTRCVEAGKKHCFKLTKGGARTYCLATESDSDMKHWMAVLSEASKPNEDALSHIPQFSVKNVSIPALSIKSPDCHGYLWKQGYTHKSWKRRYCVLKSGCLYYYEDMSEAVAIGMFKLHGYDIKETETTGRKWSMIAIPPDPRMRTFYFSAENELDFNRWYDSFRLSVRNVKAASLPR